jgi:hypothetical protein
MRAAATRITARLDKGDYDPQRFYEDSTELREKFEALDSWLSRAGFLPQDWQKDIYLADLGRQELGQ